jgi:hypothetical protein
VEKLIFGFVLPGLFKIRVKNKNITTHLYKNAGRSWRKFCLEFAKNLHQANTLLQVTRTKNLHLAPSEICSYVHK